MTTGSRLSSRAAVSNFGHCRASPNYSFKPNPLRGIACVPALRLHAFAATARVGLTQVLAINQTFQPPKGRRCRD